MSETPLADPAVEVQGPTQTEQPDEASRSVWRSVLMWTGVALGHVLVFFVVHPKLLSGDWMLGWDAINEHWGDVLFGQRALAEGHLPLWNPHERGGYPFVADPQTAVLYPITWVCWLGVWLFGPGAWVVLLRSVLHTVVAGTGVHALLGHLGHRPAVRWMASVGFILAGRVAKAKDSAGLWSPVWIPWVILALYLVIRKPSPRFGLVLGLVTALVFHSGYPPNMFRIYLAAAIIGAVLVYEVWRSAPDKRAYLVKLSKAVGIGVAVTVLLCLPGIIATSEVLPFTVRAGLKIQDIIHSSVRPAMWSEIFIPRLVKWRAYGMNYAGMLPAFLAVVALLRPTRMRLAWFGVGIFFFLLGCGHRSFLLPFAAEHLPLFKLWRIPQQYFFVTDFALVMLAAWGGSDLLKARAEGRMKIVGRAVVALGGIWAVTGAVAGWVYLGHEEQHPEQIQSVFVGAGLAVGAAILLLVLMRGGFKVRTLGFAVATVFIVADPAVQLRKTFDIMMHMPNTRRDTRLDALKLPPGSRVADDFYWQWRVGARTGARDILGRYSTMSSARHKAFAQRAVNDPRLMAAAGVHYAAGRRIPASHKRQKQVYAREKHSIYRVKSPAPYVFWTDQVVTAKTDREALLKLARLSPGEQAIIELEQLTEAQRKVVGSLKRTTDAVAGEVIHQAWGEIDLRVKAPAKGLMVWREAWYPDWTVEIDGQPAEAPFLADYLFSAVPIEPGDHTVKLRYRPRKVQMALGVWAATALGLILLGVWAIWRRRRSPQQGAS